jgi:hypothetical protein
MEDHPAKNDNNNNNNNINSKDILYQYGMSSLSVDSRIDEEVASEDVCGNAVLVRQYPPTPYSTAPKRRVGQPAAMSPQDRQSQQQQQKNSSSNLQMQTIYSVGSNDNIQYSMAKRQTGQSSMSAAAAASSSIRNSINAFQMSAETKTEVCNILNNNAICDLKRSLSQREIFNRVNIILIYLFYVFQYAGIFTTTLATEYKIQMFIWLGISLNLIASLIHSAININKNISEQLLNDINSINSNNFLDQSSIAMDEKM